MEVKDIFAYIAEDINAFKSQCSANGSSLKYQINFGMFGECVEARERKRRNNEYSLQVEYWEPIHSEEHGEGINLVTAIKLYHVVGEGKNKRINSSIKCDRTPVYKKWYPDNFDNFKF